MVKIWIFFHPYLITFALTNNHSRRRHPSFLILHILRFWSHKKIILFPSFRNTQQASNTAFCHWLAGSSDIAFFLVIKILCEYDHYDDLKKNANVEI